MASRSRREKAVGLAKFAWDRDISSTELLEMPDDRLRKLARAAGANPPSTRETWTIAAGLLDEKLCGQPLTLTVPKLGVSIRTRRSCG